MFDRETWRKEFSQQLDIGEKAEVARFKRYYNEQYKTAIDGFLLDNNPRGGNNLFKSRELENLYIQLYSNIGLRFAKWYAKSFDRLISKRQDVSGFDDVWSEGFAEAGRKVAGQRIVLLQGTAKAEVIKNLQRFMQDPEFMALGAAERGRILRSRFNKLSAYQAERIVRTEATYAANLGAERSALDVFGSDGLQKEWLTSIDGRERASHRSTNGQVVDMDKPFNVGGELLMMPGDPRGRAANVINCRCAVAHLPKPDAQPTTQLEGFQFGMAARTVGLEGGQLVAANKPTREVVQNVTSQIDIDKLNQKELLEFIEEDFKKSGITLNKFTKGTQSVKRLKEQTKQLNKLLDEYDVSDPLNKVANVDLEFRTRGRTLGFVSRRAKDIYISRGKRPEGYLSKINFGNKKAGTSWKNYTPNKNKFDRFDAFVDEANQDLYVSTHEFAHILTNTNYGMHKQFWKEFDVIKKEYFADLKNYELNDWVRVGNTNVFSKYKDAVQYDKLAVSKYAHYNDNELLAESFAEYKLSSNPRKYVVKFGNLIDKYFKK